ncbi:MAG: DegQ family serine endoprotease [Deltaproteobacteria bacterium]|nr:DegQ family serine endoprotease [Deltaproteobacteria bacterium]
MNRIHKKLAYTILFAAISLFVATTPLTAATAQDTTTIMVPANFSQLAKTAKPSVVNIRTVTTVKGGGRVFRHFFGNPHGGKSNPFEEFWGPNMENGPSRDYKQRSLGSGFIIDKDGYIVTNNHVVENADQIKVKLADDKEYDATLVGRDSKTDLALIKISAPGDLTPIKMGDSERLDVGDWVVAIGSPFGLEQTVTAGIVSAKGRTIGSGQYDDFIQTDASINPGNSGGPLINMSGEVVGINTAIVASGQGIGFAIPINLARGIVEQLKASGAVTRGWLGVGIQNLTPELTKYYKLDENEGVLVTQVFKGDPAEKSGIRANDIITEVDGRPVSSVRELSGVIANTRIGKRTTVTYMRDGKKKTVYVELAKRDDDVREVKSEPDENEDLGIQLVELSPEYVKQFGLDKDEDGVLVGGLAPGGKAENAEVKRGDLIKEVNHVKVGSIKDFRKQVNKIEMDETINFLIRRPRVGYVVVTIER